MVLFALSGCISAPSDILPTDTIWLTTPLRQCEEPAWNSWYNDLNRVTIRAPTEEEIITEFMHDRFDITVFDVRRNHNDQMACQACGCTTGYSISIRIAREKAIILESLSSQQWIQEEQKTVSAPPFIQPSGKFCDKESGICSL